MLKQNTINRLKDFAILGLIWLVGAINDRIWFALDRSVPAWDQAEYLTGSLTYWYALQNPQWFSGEWWTSFWQLSTKVPPLTYIVTGAIQLLFGIGADRATLVYLLCNGILLGCVYGLGVLLFSAEVGLWAAGLYQILPGLYPYRLQFLLDFPLTTVVVLSFFCLTVWRYLGRKKLQRSLKQEWLAAVAFGVSFGLALLVKQTALFFLFTPLLWVGIGTLRRRDWGRLGQLCGALAVSILVFGPWYQTNWLLIITGGKRATIDSAIAEGDPPLNTLAAWTYYWKILPQQVSLPLLLVPIVGILLYWIGWKYFKFSQFQPLKRYYLKTQLQNPQWGWVSVFLIGAYLISSLNMNKDDRYVIPYLPIVSLVLAYGLTLWHRRWGHQIRWGTVGLAIILMFLNLYPIAGGWGKYVTQGLSPNAQHPIYRGIEYPHAQAIATVLQTEPYLRTNIGILPSTPEVNQHNFNYYGALQNFQVYARQVGVQQRQVEQDARSLSWFVTKTGDQGSIPESQAAIVQRVEQESDFQLHQSWNLPDGESLKLYHQRQPSVTVQPLSEPQTQIQLERVVVPQQAPPGSPVPVTYEWSGAWEQLQSGIVLLTWKAEAASTPPVSPNLTQRWLHDRAIGMGNLYPRVLPADKSAPGFRVTENLAMLPPSDTAPGIYTLEATYLNRYTGETHPIPVPPVQLTVAPEAAATAAPELDLITQMRILAASLPKGREGLDPIFAEVARINQYDPIQDYLVQAQQALEYRLQQEPQNRDLTYALAFSRALQQNVKGTIAALEQVVKVDANNPYAYAYLAFVNLYNWNPKAAEKALQPALALNPDLLELQALNAVAALFQGNVVKAWRMFQVLQPALGG